MKVQICRLIQRSAISAVNFFVGKEGLTTEIAEIAEHKENRCCNLTLRFLKKAVHAPPRHAAQAAQSSNSYLRRRRVRWETG
jgi:hypothetical protein